MRARWTSGPLICGYLRETGVVYDDIPADVIARGLAEAVDADGDPIATETAVAILADGTPVERPADGSPVPGEVRPDDEERPRLTQADTDDQPVLGISDAPRRRGGRE